MNGGSTRLRWLQPAIALGISFATAAPAAPTNPDAGLIVEHAVFVMRHGVRPPTADPAMPEGIATQPWPAWSVPPGNLTEHGADAIRLIGAGDRAELQEEGLLPRTGCPEPGRVVLASDSGQRTIATGDAWASAFTPNCVLANEHPPEKVRDPLFAAMADKADLDSSAAYRAIRAELGPEGIAGLDGRLGEALRTIDHILCGERQTGCGLPDKSSALEEPKPGKAPKVSGALSRGSTAAQILLLEYAEGKPMRDVGWGSASAADIALVGSLHSAGFALDDRTPYIAQRSYHMLRERMAASLVDGGPKVTMLVGHDGTVASLGGLLGLHWHVPGFAADDPAPGGALVFETVRDGGGHRFVRAFYRSQTLQQIRDLSPGKPMWQPLPIGACGATPVLLCPKAMFDRLLAGRAEAAVPSGSD
jgi:4-phytase/acid phosphatase